MSAPVVVAGASGYLGGRVVGSLADAGRRVVALVGRKRPWLERPGVRQVALDLRDPVIDLTDTLAGATALVHLAGPSEVLAARAPERVLADTVAISANLARAAAATGLDRVVYLSTVHVYGARATPGAHLSEDLRPEPRHPYAIARLASEHVLASEAPGTVVLRLTNSVGAPADPAVDRWTLLVNDLARTAALEGVLRLQSDGTQWRDFIALADAIRTIGAVVDGALHPGTWNLGSGTPWTVRQIATLVADVVESTTGTRPPLLAPEPAAEPLQPPIVAIDRLAAAGLAPTTAIEDAIAETVRFCVAHRADLPR